MHHGLLHTDGLDASAHIQEETFRELRWPVEQGSKPNPYPTYENYAGISRTHEKSTGSANSERSDARRPVLPETGKAAAGLKI